MSQLHIYLEDGRVIYPSEGNNPPEYFSELSADYVELYVDIDQTELIIYLPASITLQGRARTENLFFHYKSQNPDNLFTEFNEIIKLNNEHKITNGATDTTAEAKRMGLPENLIEDGLFKQSWSLDDAHHSTEIPGILANSEPQIPDLTRLRQQVFEDLVGSQWLRLGVQNLETGSQIIKYLFQNDFSVHTALADVPTTVTLTNVDALFTLGHEPNFKPLDTPTTSSLESATKEKVSNWKSELLREIESEINELRSLDDKVKAYNDLSEIKRFISDGDQPETHSETAERIIDLYNTIQADEHLSSKDKQEVLKKLRQEIKDNRSRFADEIQGENIKEFQKILDEIENARQVTLDHKLDHYRNFSEIEKILLKSSSSPENPSEDIRRFNRKWRSLILNDSFDDNIVDYIRNRLREEIKSKKEDWKEETIEKAEDVCRSVLIDQLKNGKQGYEQVEAIRDFLNKIDNPDNTIDDAKNRNSQVQYLFNAIFREDIGKDIKGQLHKRVRDVTEHGLASAYFEIIDNSTRSYINEEPQNVFNFLTAVERTLEGDVKSGVNINNEQGAKVLEAIRRAKSDELLTNNGKEWINRETSKLISELEQRNKSNHKKALMNCLEKTKESYIPPEEKIQIYDEMETVLDKGGLENPEHEETDNFNKLWKQIIEYNVGSEEWRRNLSANAVNEIRKNASVAKMSSRGRGANSSSNRYNSSQNDPTSPKPDSLYNNNSDQSESDGGKKSRRFENDRKGNSINNSQSKITKALNFIISLKGLFIFLTLLNLFLVLVILEIVGIIDITTAL